MEQETVDSKARRKRLVILNIVVAALIVLVSVLLYFYLCMKPVLVGVDTNESHRCNISFMNKKTGDVVFFDSSKKDTLKAIHFVMNYGKHFVSVYFDKDGLVKNICTENVAASFSKYKGFSVSVAVLEGNTPRYFENLKTDVNWDDMRSAKADESYENSNHHYTSEELYVLKRLPTIEARLMAANEAMKLLGRNGYSKLTGDAVWALGVCDDIKDYADHKWRPRLLNDYDVKSCESQFEKYYDARTDKNVKFKKLSNCLRQCKTWKPFYDWWFKAFDDAYKNLSLDFDLVEGAVETGMGRLKVTLAWDFYGDIDLHALEPSGNVINYQRKHSPVSDGYLDHDNVEGGRGAVENMYWENPPSGHYSFKLNYFMNSRSEQSGTCKVIVMLDGRGQLYEIPMSHRGETEDICELDIP